jgi:dCMP deaminase
MNKWDKRFIELAQHVSLWSKDPSTKVGAVITDKQQRIISLGFNGFPRGVMDSDERLENREVKYKIVVHGEVNAILFAGRALHGCTVYTWPFLSCSTCTSIIINAGIKRIVAPEYFPERWKESFDLSLKLYKEARVQVFLIPLNSLSVSPV